MKAKHQYSEKMEYSACSWERGRTLCTIYPREGYFTVMVVIGTREKDAAEAILPDCTKELQGIYGQTKEGNGQKWMTIDLEDRGGLYEDVLRLIEIRRGEARPPKCSMPDSAASYGWNPARHVWLSL